METPKTVFRQYEYTKKENKGLQIGYIAAPEGDLSCSCFDWRQDAPSDIFITVDMEAEIEGYSHCHTYRPL